MGSIVLKNSSNRFIHIIDNQFVLPPTGLACPTRYFCREKTFWVEYYDTPFTSNSENIKRLVEETEDLELYLNGMKLTPQQISDRIELNDVPEATYGILNNFISVVDPTSEDDRSKGYGPGSIWINQTSIRVFICITALSNEAVWLNLTP